MTTPRPRTTRRRALVAAGTALATAATGTLLASGLPAGAAGAAPTTPAVASAASGASAAADAAQAPSAGKRATAKGRGGAVSTVDPFATRVGIRVLRQGGNAVDAAVATAAALGVTEPYSAGIGGGGYFVHYDAKSGKVRTIDGRETAPRSIPNDAFIDPATGEPYNFTPELVTSGVSVGVPGTPATWERALERWGTWSLAEALEPGRRLAERGFRVDQTFRDQTLDNAERFAAFPATADIYLPKGDAPKVGSTLRQPDLADTYALLADSGTRAFYRGKVARDIVKAVRKPATASDTTLPVPAGFMTRSDLKRYKVSDQRPSRTTYRGYDVYGMAPSSSGGSTVGEALNILETSDLGALDPTAAMHRYLEAGALAFADRAKYVGDARFVDVPLGTLLSQGYADERACLIDPAKALPKPVAAGDVNAYDGTCGPARPGVVAEDTENESTTNLTVVDRWGNVVEYTLTIEQTGGSGMVVPGRGFLLNNELTDFSTEYKADDPNRIQGGKRPRSSMSPTIVLRDGKPWLALGSPGGSTIITTVLQMLLNRIDLGMSIEEAMAAPRATPRNTATVTAEQAFIDAYGPALTALGHQLAPAGDGLTSDPFIGAATAIEIGKRGRLTAVAEPERRGGGSAMVVRGR